MAQLIGKAAMPVPRLKKALMMFNGEEDAIAEFLDIYEQCADDAQLPKTERVKFMFRYIDQSQCLTFEAFEGYANEDWDVFSVAIKEAFGGVFQTKQCMRAALDTFIHTSAAKVITTDTKLRIYHRDFQGKAAYLINNKQLSEKDAAHYYWFGFHPSTQEQLERRLGIIKPDHPLEKLFAIADVYKAGCYIFNSSTFHRVLPSVLPTPNVSIQSPGVTGDSQVVKKTVRLPSELLSDVTDLLQKLHPLP
ncbi:hypothetical protein JB92DRAFT_3105950 [Gautieria morchelliformis]|nr:hypothetical protein JB92DRAFT_3105950 [Gautieria morchelliformis]